MTSSTLDKNEHPAEKAIREHNEGCEASCRAQRPHGEASGCGYQNEDGSLRYKYRRCPTCPIDWKIEYEQPKAKERGEYCAQCGRCGEPMYWYVPHVCMAAPSASKS